MLKNNRREFLKLSTAAALGTGLAVGQGGSLMAASATAGAGVPGAAIAPKPMRLGVIVGIDRDPEAAIAKVHSLGLPTCQVHVEYLDADLVSRLRNTRHRYGIEVTSLVTGGPGAQIYNFYDGPLTLGVVPRTYRAARIERLKQMSDFARQLGIPAVQTHAGFIPEDPNDPLYAETIEALREVVSHCKKNGQNFRYETGTETPITMLRAIRDVGLDNQGVNFDTANLILYGRANPLDALDIIGPYVQGMHAKDGLYPTDPHNLGEEVAIPHGKVDFPRILQRLKELNYQGAVTIEREISGPEQLEDVRKEKDYLENLIRKIQGA